MPHQDKAMIRRYEPCPPDYVLQEGDRMRRTNPLSGRTTWFPLPSFDVGQRAGYFRGGGFEVQRRIRPQPPSKYPSPHTQLLPV